MLFIRFDKGTRCEDVLRDGWSRPEKDLVWSNSLVSRIVVSRPHKRGSYVIRAKIKPFVCVALPRQRIQIEINNVVVGQNVIDREETYSWWVDASTIQSHDSLEIKFSNPDAATPKSFGITDDERLLAIALRSITVFPQLIAEGEFYEFTPKSLLSATRFERDELIRARAADLRIASETFFYGNDVKFETEFLFERFLEGVGATAHHFRKDSKNVVARRLTEDKYVDHIREAFEHNFSPRRPVLNEILPQYKEALFQFYLPEGLERHTIFPEGSNASYTEELPAPINMVLRRKTYPALDLISVSDHVAFISPFGYQVYNQSSGLAIPGASPQCFLRTIEYKPTVSLKGNLVICQDWFAGSNFSHFIFDWITRAAHFCEAMPELISTTSFLFGGQSYTKFHEIVLEALCNVYGLDKNQALFPVEGYNLCPSERIFWFSDQLEHYTHPAQMMSSASVTALRRISNAVDILKGPHRAIYISRRDAQHRRCLNEAELIDSLRQYDIVEVVLGELSIRDQISLIRGADLIVAPHGMGLTHLVFHQGRPSVIELHNQTLGSDAYALLSRAFEFRYRFVLSEEVEENHRDYCVNIDSVLDAVESAISG